MANEPNEARFEGSPNGELPATEKQRHALCRWGVERERTEDPGLTRGEASRWLGALIEKAKPRAKSDGEDIGGPEVAVRKPSAAPRPPVLAPPEGGTAESRGPSLPRPKSVAAEPATLEIELTAPTGIRYSGIRVRASASRAPGETLEGLGDRLTDLLGEIVRREAERFERALSGRPAGLEPRLGG